MRPNLDDGIIDDRRGIVMAALFVMSCHLSFQWRFRGNNAVRRDGVFARILN
jgi:hypothetical protein